MAGGGNPVNRMSLPQRVRSVLPPDTAAAWPKVVSCLPDGAYLAGGTALAVHLSHRISRDLDVFVQRPFDTAQLRTRLASLGNLTVTSLSDDTLNGVLDHTKVQFLLADTQQPLDAFEDVAGMPVSGLRDLLATKLKVIANRGELRDYFDLMKIEEMTEHRVEQGLSYYLRRYRVGPDDSSLGAIVRALGYLDDVAPDPGLPVTKEDVAAYWSGRLGDVARSLQSLTTDDHGPAA